MTTLAYRDNILAFDSMITDSALTGYATKGRKTSKYLIACAGEWQDCEAFLDWGEQGAVFEDRRKFGLDREVEISGMIVDKKGKVWMYESRLYPMVIDAPFYALGSGSHLALGAMAHGATAHQAVKIAAKFDPFTGGTVRELSWDIPKRKK